MEVHRAQNADTRIVFPIMKNDGTLITGATGLDSQYALLGAHAGAAPSFGACTNEAQEIGSTGIYYLDVEAAEVNDSQGSVIEIKSSSSGAVPQVILINTKIEGLITTVDTVADGIETHVHATDGHITADYTATEKTAIDLLDDAAGGLADIHTDVGTAITNIGTVDGVADAVKLKTDLIPASPAAVGSAMTLTSDYDSAKAAASQTSVNTVDTVADAIKVVTDLLAGMYETDGAVKRWTANSLEQAPSGSGASAETIADAVWNELMADHITAGTFGLIQCLLANAEITNNQLILKDTAGNIKFTFNLTQDGTATEFNPDKRAIV